jgi:exonuclease VII small subunit
VAKAATEATEGKDDALAKFDNALELAKEVHAELKATEQHPQVQLAFDKGVLDADKYGLE